MIALDAGVLIALFDTNDPQMLADIHALGITIKPLPGDAAARLARLRAHTGTKMPVCCVLLTAEQTSARVATFDDRPTKSANSLGLEVV